MLNHIPHQRLLLYALLGGLIPLALVIFTFFNELQTLDHLEQRIETVQHKALQKEKKQAVNLAIRNHFKDADHFYIDKHLETLTFLEPEIESLQKLVSSNHYIENEAIRKRLEWLTSSTNTLAFSEGVVQSYPTFQETTETLVHPVETDLSDVRKILSRIEGIQIGPYLPIPNRPQLIILEFKLDKKEITEKNEVFTLNLKLLKREFI